MNKILQGAQKKQSLSVNGVLLKSLKKEEDDRKFELCLNPNLMLL